VYGNDHARGVEDVDRAVARQRRQRHRRLARVAPPTVVRVHADAALAL